MNRTKSPFSTLLRLLFLVALLLGAGVVYRHGDELKRLSSLALAPAPAEEELAAPPVQLRFDERRQRGELDGSAEGGAESEVGEVTPVTLAEGPSAAGDESTGGAAPAAKFAWALPQEDRAVGPAAESRDLPAAANEEGQPGVEVARADGSSPSADSIAPPAELEPDSVDADKVDGESVAMSRDASSEPALEAPADLESSASDGRGTGLRLPPPPATDAAGLKSDFAAEPVARRGEPGFAGPEAANETRDEASSESPVVRKSSTKLVDDGSAAAASEGEAKGEETVASSKDPASSESSPSDANGRPTLQVRRSKSSKESEPVREAREVDGLAATTTWPHAEALRQAFAELAQDSEANAWASEVLAALDKLEAVSSFGAPEAAAELTRLRGLSETARQQVTVRESTPLHTRLLRANYGLQRRVALWQALQLAGSARPEGAIPVVSRKELTDATAAVDAFLATTGRQIEWRRFLLLDDVSKTLKSSGDVTTEGRALARCILARLDSTHLTPTQAKFLDRPVIEKWTELLQKWAVEPVDQVELARLVERYESEPSGLIAREIARANQVLRWAPDQRLTEVGTQLNLHYRNANVRVAVSSEFANRLMPPLRYFEAPVDDVIRNTRVVGTSQTAARSRVVLFSDRAKWNVGLDVLGSVASETQGQRGPAVFFQDGQARFHARKLIFVDHQGIQTKPAFGVAEAASKLTGVETDFDGVPLMNRLARSIAQRQYDEQSTLAQSEVETRIANEASRRLDDEVAQILADGQKRLQSQLIKPLADLGLEPTPIDFETTRTRLIARYRLAGSHQLAAHSPRPQAPSNSLVSVQVHESALNNLIEQLRLNGRQVGLEELIREVAQRIGRPNPQLPDDLPEEVTVRFAAEDAVRLKLEDGKVVVTIQVAELRHGRESQWKNFFVRAAYVPRMTGRKVELVRDGIIELGGDRRRIGDQVALRAIFAKVLSKNRPIPLVPAAVIERREFADLEASQAVVEDGWLGVTLAQAPSVARQRTATPR